MSIVRHISATRCERVGPPHRSHHPRGASTRCRLACIGLAVARCASDVLDRAEQESRRLTPGAEEMLRQGAAEAERLKREAEDLLRWCHDSGLLSIKSSGREIRVDSTCAKQSEA